MINPIYKEFYMNYVFILNSKILNKYLFLLFCLFFPFSFSYHFFLYVVSIIFSVFIFSNSLGSYFKYRKISALLVNPKNLKFVINHSYKKTQIISLILVLFIIVLFFFDLINSVEFSFINLVMILSIILCFSFFVVIFNFNPEREKYFYIGIVPNTFISGYLFPLFIIRKLQIGVNDEMSLFYEFNQFSLHIIFGLLFLLFIPLTLQLFSVFFLKSSFNDIENIDILSILFKRNVLNLEEYNSVNYSFLASKRFYNLSYTENVFIFLNSKSIFHIKNYHLLKNRFFVFELLKILCDNNFNFLNLEKILIKSIKKDIKFIALIILNLKLLKINKDISDLDYKLFVDLINGFINNFDEGDKCELNEILYEDNMSFDEINKIEKKKLDLIYYYKQSCTLNL